MAASKCWRQPIGGMAPTWSIAACVPPAGGSATCLPAPCGPLDPRAAAANGSVTSAITSGKSRHTPGSAIPTLRGYSPVSRSATTRPASGASAGLADNGRRRYGIKARGPGSIGGPTLRTQSGPGKRRRPSGWKRRRSDTFHLQIYLQF